MVDKKYFVPLQKGDAALHQARLSSRHRVQWPTHTLPLFTLSFPHGSRMHARSTHATFVPHPRPPALPYPALPCLRAAPHLTCAQSDMYHGANVTSGERKCMAMWYMTKVRAPHPPPFARSPPSAAPSGVACCSLCAAPCALLFCVPPFLGLFYAAMVAMLMLRSEGTALHSKFVHRV